MRWIKGNDISQERICWASYKFRNEERAKAAKFEFIVESGESEVNRKSSRS